ncbi:MAG: hypothetical protein ACRCY3_15680 [Sphingorhabdus sp.]
MTDERITETTDANGNVTERIIERNHNPTAVTVNTGDKPGNGGISGILAILALAVLAIGGYFLLTNNSEERKDNAVAEAADDIGAAAEKAGNAVEKAADNLTK